MAVDFKGSFFIFYSGQWLCNSNLKGSSTANQLLGAIHKDICTKLRKIDPLVCKIFALTKPTSSRPRETQHKFWKFWIFLHQKVQTHLKNTLVHTWQTLLSLTADVFYG